MGIDEWGLIKIRIKSGNETAPWIWIEGGVGGLSRSNGCSEEMALMAGVCHVEIRTGLNNTVAENFRQELEKLVTNRSCPYYK